MPQGLPTSTSSHSETFARSQALGSVCHAEALQRKSIPRLRSNDTSARARKAAQALLTAECNPELGILLVISSEGLGGV